MIQASDIDTAPPAAPSSTNPASMEAHTPPIQTQISDRPEPMPLWLAWVLLVLLIILAAFTLYLYVTTQYVPER
ncbi:hypothetical protein GCM10022631_08080 [Deinococcus rubellus]|uniref:hypothetical protein n=1 Tax=Deinococcus rubellus TaxID=1889240 RepID=UPI0031E7CB98